MENNKGQENQPSQNPRSYQIELEGIRLIENVIIQIPNYLRYFDDNRT